MVDLLARYSITWLHDHLIVYADDFHLRWTFSTQAEGLLALSELSFVLILMQSYGLRINVQKSVALCRVVGRAAPTFLRQWITRTTDGPRLRLPDHDWKLPLVSKTAYLGVILKYRAWENDTTKRRIAAAEHCFHVLRRWLTDPVIPLHLKFKLYRQCVLPTLQYGIFEMGITKQGFENLISTINTHHRRMIREPVHLTHESTADCFQRLGLDAPWVTLQRTQARLEAALHTRRCSLSGSMANQSQDICVLTPDYPISDLTTPILTPDQVAPDASLQCPECHRSFSQAGTLKRHLRQ